MIEHIELNSKTLAIIVKASFQSDGINFLTPDDYSLQLAVMNRPAGYHIQPHVHRLIDRRTQLTQEVLVIRKGKLRVDFYDDNQVYYTSRMLEKGDVILLTSGGHGFEITEDTEIIEVKQGPFIPDMDKIRFQAVDAKLVNYGAITQ
jgi:hypothetical protein